ncbi:MAG: hypothetical protein ACRD2Z_16590 [Thermoanaerobaculia bacterium]
MSRRRLRRSAAGTFALALLAAPLLAGTVEVGLTLPVRARIDMEGRRNLAITPFQVVSRETAETELRRDVDVQAEFERYLARLIQRNTRLEVVESGPVELPTYDLELLSRQQDFWASLGERSGADLLLAGSLDFDVQDRSGYRREEYVSPYDGRTYYRQVLVEQTGFEYDIVLQVYDGQTGQLLHADNFKDFKQFEGNRADPLRGMFENLYALEDRIANVFVQRTVETTRVLYTD